MCAYRSWGRCRSACCSRSVAGSDSCSWASRSSWCRCGWHTTTPRRPRTSSSRPTPLSSNEDGPRPTHALASARGHVDGAQGHVNGPVGGRVVPPADSGPDRRGRATPGRGARPGHDRGHDRHQPDRPGHGTRARSYRRHARELSRGPAPRRERPHRSDHISRPPKPRSIRSRRRSPGRRQDRLAQGNAAEASSTTTEKSYRQLEPLLDRLPDVLGAKEPQTYLLTIMNPAEQRYSGGATLQMATIRFDDGVITFGAEPEASPTWTTRSSSWTGGGARQHLPPPGSDAGWPRPRTPRGGRSPARSCSAPGRPRPVSGARA